MPAPHPVSIAGRPGARGWRWLSLLLILCAAFPFRIRHEFLVFNSFSVLDIALLLTPILLLLVVLDRGGAFTLGDRWIGALLAVPIVLAVFSLLWSQDRAQTFYYLTNTVLAYSAYLFVVNVLLGQPPQFIARLMAGFVIVACLVAILSTLNVPGFAPYTYGLTPGTPEYTAFKASYHSRLSHPFWGRSNDLASVLAFFPLIFITYGFEARRSAYLPLATLTLLCIFLTMSRGVGLAVIAGAAIFVIAAPRTMLRTAVAVVTAGAAFSAVMYAGFQYNEFVRRYLATRLTYVNIADRLNKFEHAVEKIRAAPIWGYGAGVVPDREPALVGGSHNTYLESWMHFGIPLGTAFSVSLLALVLFFYSHHRHLGGSLLPTAVAAAVLVQLLIFTNQTYFEATLLRVLFYLVIGLGVALLASIAIQRATGDRIDTLRRPAAHARSRGW